MHDINGMLSVWDDAGRPWNGCAAQEVAEDMFNQAALVVENEDKPPGGACPPKPDWDSPLRCYSPTMFNAEVVTHPKCLCLHLLHCNSGESLLVTAWSLPGHCLVTAW